MLRRFSISFNLCYLVVQQYSSLCSFSFFIYPSPFFYSFLCFLCPCSTFTFPFYVLFQSKHVYFFRACFPHPWRAYDSRRDCGVGWRGLRSERSACESARQQCNQCAAVGSQPLFLQEGMYERRAKCASDNLAVRCKKQRRWMSGRIEASSFLRLTCWSDNCCAFCRMQPYGFIDVRCDCNKKQSEGRKRSIQYDFIGRVSPLWSNVPSEGRNSIRMDWLSATCHSRHSTRLSGCWKGGGCQVVLNDKPVYGDCAYEMLVSVCDEGGNELLGIFWAAIWLHICGGPYQGYCQRNDAVLISAQAVTYILR